MANSFEEDNDAPMDTIEDNDIEMSASDPVVNEAPNSKENNNANDEDNNSQNSDDSTPKSTQSPQSLSSPSNDNDTTQQHESSLLTQMNEWITTMPPKMEQCSKAQFYAVLLLRIEVENINATHKIDYLLLFNFIQNTPPFKAFPFLTFGENVSKLAKDDILKLFTEKTDFDAPKLSQIFDAISTNDTTETIHKFQQNASQIDLPQTAAKFQKCASELSTPNIDTEGDDDEDMEEEETKEHVQDEERMQFKVGNKIDCRDQWGVWCVSEIKRHKKATELLVDLEREDLQGLEGIYVHYDGWVKQYDGDIFCNYDEWIFIDTDGDIFCNCSDKCENKELNQHLIAREKTQTVYAKRRTKPSHVVKEGNIIRNPIIPLTVPCNTATEEENKEMDNTKDDCTEQHKEEKQHVNRVIRLLRKSNIEPISDDFLVRALRIFESNYGYEYNLQVLQDIVDTLRCLNTTQCTPDDEHVNIGPVSLSITNPHAMGDKLQIYNQEMEKWRLATVRWTDNNF
eukprot:50368_1